MSLVRRYETLRRKTPEQRREDGDDFWDMVVLSAGNEEQKYPYQKQISKFPPLTYIFILGRATSANWIAAARSFPLDAKSGFILTLAGRGWGTGGARCTYSMPW